MHEMCTCADVVVVQGFGLPERAGHKVRTTPGGRRRPAKVGRYISRFAGDISKPQRSNN
jgi:hypothetical protein